MGEFLFEYGLFAAKVLTFIGVILMAVLAFALALSSRQQERESIEIDKINEKYSNLREALEAEILSKEELKALKKQRKKEEKPLSKKGCKILSAFKKKEQAAELEPPKRNRLFVTKFIGDIHASEVNTLREAITAILCVAKPEDEVLVILESAGGLVHNYGLAASQLQRIRNHSIPLTVAVDLVAASGGYLMAVVANKIIAAPFAVIGSIGVLAQVPNIHRLLEKYDIDVEQHTAGEYKTTLTLLGKNTDKARKKFQEELEDTHDLFKEYVLKHRPQLQIDKLATGEHWYGARALELMLIDEIITSDDYLLKKSTDTDIYQVKYVISETFKDKISHILNEFTGQLRLLKKIWHQLTVLKH